MHLHIWHFYTFIHIIYNTYTGLFLFYHVHEWDRLSTTREYFHITGSLWASCNLRVDLYGRDKILNSIQVYTILFFLWVSCVVEKVILFSFIVIYHAFRAHNFHNFFLFFFLFHENRFYQSKYEFSLTEIQSIHSILSLVFVPI